MISKKQQVGWGGWIGLMWRRTRIGKGRLYIRWWPSGLHKMWKISWLSVKVLVFQEKLLHWDSYTPLTYMFYTGGKNCCYCCRATHITGNLELLALVRTFLECLVQTPAEAPALMFTIFCGFPQYMQRQYVCLHHDRFLPNHFHSNIPPFKHSTQSATNWVTGSVDK